MGCTVKERNWKAETRNRFCFLLYKVLGYPKESENVPYIFPACYSERQSFYIKLRSIIFNIIFNKIY